MANATDQQVQTFVDRRVRVRAEQVRALVLALNDDISVIDDVYNALNTNPTWTDDRDDGPPHLLAPSDVLAYNSFIHDILTSITGNGQYPVILKACVRPVGI